MHGAPNRKLFLHLTEEKARRVAGLFVVILLSACCSLFPTRAQEKPQEAVKAAEKAPEPAKPAEYAGSDTCQACHEDIHKAFQKNPHHFVEKDNKRGWEGKACESCHGPGSKHAESVSPADISNPAKLRPAQADQVCLKCHLNQPTHAGRLQGGHARNQVSCMSCHAMHKGPSTLVARSAPAKNQLCASCHTSEWAQFAKPHKHRLPEGAMSCVDCHNPHGSYLWKSIQTVNANEPGCFKCHSDKRGPFVFEHPPVKLEGCTSCHEPHGSANPRMLTRQEIRFVCLECHANLPTPTAASAGVIGGPPPAFHDLRNPRFRNCTICHVKIHGSQASRELTR